MINILHVINGWPTGGIAEQTYLLCKYLPQDQFKQYSVGYCHFNGAFVKKFEDVGVSCLESNESYDNINAIIEKYHIDIVHKQTGGGDYPEYINRLPLNVKVVETLHCPRKTGLPRNKVNKIIYTTEYTKEKNSLEYYDIMESIQYALDLPCPLRDEPYIRNEYPINVGRLGRIVADKRPDVILELADMSLGKYGDKVHFCIAGQIPQDYPAHIQYGEQFLREVKKRPNIDYFGYVEDKYEFWLSLDICINPVCETSFDIVFLEAMACGIPILTWDNSAAKYVVEDAGIVTKENIQDLFDGLCLLIDDKEKRRGMGANGITLINGKYNLSHMINLYSKIYKNLFGG